MLYQLDMFSRKNKIETALERIATFVPSEGYYLAFSGGKDSCVLKKLAELAGVRCDAHYNVTTIDPPELVKFIKKNHADVIFDRPAMSFLHMLPTKGFPTRMARWCCEELKECHGGGRKVLTGIRWAESAIRAKRQMVETCYKDKIKTFVNPIIDWSDAEIWEFIRLFRLPYCGLYNCGFKRIGCLFCPMLYYKRRQLECERYPHMAKAFIRAFEKLHKLRTSQQNPSVAKWRDGEEMFRWWINSAPPRKSESTQLPLFE